MPFKWKLYRISAIYLIIVGIAFCILAIYAIVVGGFDRNILRVVSTIFAMSFILSVKSIYSIKALKHFKSGTLLTQSERVIFIIGFIIVAAGTILGIEIFVSIMIPELYRDFTNPNYYYELFDPKNDGTTILAMVLLGLFVIALICSTFNSIFDLILLRAIRKKHYAMLDDIGNNIVETN